MVVCICRDIRDSEYNDHGNLLNRLLDEDVCCGKCIEEFVDVDAQKQTTQLHIFINNCGGNYEKENHC